MNLRQIDCFFALTKKNDSFVKIILRTLNFAILHKKNVSYPLFIGEIKDKKLEKIIKKKLKSLI